MSRLSDTLSTSKPKVFITAYGFEDRATSLLSALRGHVRFHSGIAIGFPTTPLGSTAQWQRHKSFIDDALTDMCTQYSVTNVSINEPIAAVRAIREQCKKAGVSLSESHVLVDITSIPKFTLLMLLKLIAEAGGSGHLFYVEPAGYELPISIGVRDVRTLPFFGSGYKLKKRKLLVQMLGFEGLRAFAVQEVVDPHRTIALVGIPAAENMRWADVSIRENRLILSRANVELRQISFADISSALATLEALHDEFGSDYNIFVSSLGTKLSTVPVFFHLRQHKDVYLVFSRPELHTEHSSYGSGNVVITRFSQNDAMVVGRCSLDRVIQESALAHDGAVPGL